MKSYVEAGIGYLITLYQKKRVEKLEYFEPFNNFRRKKWSFPLRISSVNVTNSAGSCGFGHIY